MPKIFPFSYQTLRRHCENTLHEYPNLEGPIQEDEIKCEDCHKIMKRKHYDFHQSRYHRGYKLKTLKCKLCDYETPRRDNLRRHETLKRNITYLM